MRSRSIVLAAALLLGGYLLACLGEDPDLDGTDRTADAAVGDTTTTQDDGGAESSAPPEADAASAASGDAAGDACGAPKDQTPCGCGPASNCCLWADGKTECYPAGNAPDECMSGPSFLIACVGRASCGPNKTCCVVSGVLGGTCPVRLERWDTACNVDGPDPCAGKPVLCASDSDCVLSDAGTCVAAVMDGLERAMGICVK